MLFCGFYFLFYLVHYFCKSTEGNDMKPQIVGIRVFITYRVVCTHIHTVNLDVGIYSIWGGKK